MDRQFDFRGGLYDTDQKMNSEVGDVVVVVYLHCDSGRIQLAVESLLTLWLWSRCGKNTYNVTLA